MIKIGLHLPLAVFTAAITGCSDGGISGSNSSSSSNSSGLTCSQFTYQEDAQEAYRSGATQLDGDNDGVACESLPRKRKQLSNIALHKEFNNERTSYDFLTSQSELVSLRPVDEGYVVAVYGAGGTSVVGPVAIRQENEIQEIASSVQTIKFLRSSDNSLISWSSATIDVPESIGIGSVVSSPINIDTLSGTYKLLGQRCTALTNLCAMAYATARLEANGELNVCVKDRDTNGCAENVIRKLQTQNKKLQNVWSLGDIRENLISPRSGEIAFSYHDGNKDMPTRLVFFGQLANSTEYSPLENEQLLTFSSQGQFSVANPSASSWRVLPNTPFDGFFGDTEGNAYLRSTNGGLIAWGNQEGLSIYARP